MSYLLDTNIVSELRKSARRADAGVRAWVAGRAPSDLYLSAISVLRSRSVSVASLAVNPSKGRAADLARR